MSDPIYAVEIRGELRKLQTMADGSVNVLINLGEDCIPQVKVMLDWIKLEVTGVLTLVDNASEYGGRLK